MSKILKYGRGTQIGKQLFSSLKQYETLVKSEESIDGKTAIHWQEGYLFLRDLSYAQTWKNGLKFQNSLLKNISKIIYLFNFLENDNKF